MRRRLAPDRFRRFLLERSGIVDTQTALLIAGVSLAVAVLAAPVLQGAVDSYAQYRTLGIDRVLTGSVGDNRRLTIRNSVLTQTPVVLCDTKSRQSCVNR